MSEEMETIQESSSSEKKKPGPKPKAKINLEDKVNELETKLATLTACVEQLATFTGNQKMLSLYDLKPYDLKKTDLRKQGRS